MNKKEILIKLVITLAVCTAFSLLFASVGDGKQQKVASSHVVEKTCSANVCSAIVNLYDKQYVMQYTLDTDGNIDGMDVLLPHDATREEYLALKDAVLSAQGE